MRVRRILVVCVGNICRSPVGERLLDGYLRSAGASISVESAGLGALVGHSADKVALEVALERGLSLEGHIARQFDADMGLAADLILVMEAGHRREIGRLLPSLVGRTMLFDHWNGGRGIADPYRKSEEFHKIVYDDIRRAAESWSLKLTPRHSVLPSERAD